MLKSIQNLFCSPFNRAQEHFHKCVSAYDANGVDWNGRRVCILMARGVHLALFFVEMIPFVNILIYRLDLLFQKILFPSFDSPCHAVNVDPSAPDPIKTLREELVQDIQEKKNDIRDAISKGISDLERLLRFEFSQKYACSFPEILEEKLAAEDTVLFQALASKNEEAVNHLVADFKIKIEGKIDSMSNFSWSSLNFLLSKEMPLKEVLKNLGIVQIKDYSERIGMQYENLITRGLHTTADLQTLLCDSLTEALINLEFNHNLFLYLENLPPSDHILKTVLAQRLGSNNWENWLKEAEDSFAEAIDFEMKNYPAILSDPKGSEWKECLDQLKQAQGMDVLRECFKRLLCTKLKAYILGGLMNSYWNQKAEAKGKTLEQVAQMLKDSGEFENDRWVLYRLGNRVIILA